MSTIWIVLILQTIAMNTIWRVLFHKPDQSHVSYSEHLFYSAMKSTYRLFVGYVWSCFDEPVLIEEPKLLLIEFDIHHGWESCDLAQPQLGTLSSAA